jgi:hypothetical protein
MRNSENSFPYKFFITGLNPYECTTVRLSNDSRTSLVDIGHWGIGYWELDTGNWILDIKIQKYPIPSIQ